jgi:hypothetical protein
MSKDLGSLVGVNPPLGAVHTTQEYSSSIEVCKTEEGAKI